MSEKPPVPDPEELEGEERADELEAEEPEAPKPGGYAPSVAARLAFYQRAGGVATPLITTILAFFVGGLVVLVISGKNPLNTYREIFDGTGLNWLFGACGYGTSISCRAAG